MISARDLVRQRSGAMCESMVVVRGVYTRCGRPATDLHHMLTRSRGGDVLDSVGETYHLIDQCHSHHMWVHQNVSASTDAGLYLQGHAWIDGTRVVYVGPDDYLRSRYPRNTYDHEVRFARQAL